MYCTIYKKEMKVFVLVFDLINAVIIFPLRMNNHFQLIFKSDVDIFK
jgi:hypothetical protein